MSACRCGWSGEGDHLCHRCGKRAGSLRFYNATAVALAGAQLKFQVSDTWGCDECWEAFKKQQEEKARNDSELPGSSDR